MTHYEPGEISEVLSPFARRSRFVTTPSPSPDCLSAFYREEARRVGILLVTLVMLMLPSNYCVEAQEPGKAYRIGVLISASPIVAPFTDAFREGMRELGYIEGKNYVLEIRARGPKTDQLSNLATELVANRSGNRNRRSDSGLSEVGAKTLDTKDVAPWVSTSSMRSRIRSKKITAAIHVYGGDIFGVPRSEWDPNTFEERPFDVAAAMRVFEESNKRLRAAETAE